MAESLGDYFHTPFSWETNKYQDNASSVQVNTGQIHGVELHAHILNQLLRFALKEVHPIRSFTETQEIVWIWFWCTVGSLLSFQKLAQVRFFPYLLIELPILATTCYIALLQRWWIPLMPPALGLFCAAAMSTIYISAHEYAEKKLLMQLFSRYVSQDVAETIWQARKQFLKGGRLRPHRLTGTVLFSDIQDFTSVSETLDPAALMDWLNTYMEAMAQVVMAHGGIVDKYIGDAVMAIFGIPIPRTTQAEIAQDAVHAVICALAMSEELKRLNRQWQLQGLPTIAMRIGIYTGPLVAGNVGCSQRLEYTVLGDTVNTASRLEGFHKDNFDSKASNSACRILIGESTFRYLDGRFQAQQVGIVALKGKKEGIAVYRVLGYRY